MSDIDQNSEYFDMNKTLWNARTAVHLKSDFYDNNTFLNGRNTLSEPEMNNLGDVSGKSIIHLQCHFGQDSLSLARMGAHVTGIDISDAAITKAQEMNEQLNLTASFICCNVMDTLAHVRDTFDIVFVTYGATCWLPDLKPWAHTVSELLKPGGFLYYCEFHPTFYMIDDTKKRIGFPYFNTGVQVESNDSSYTDGDTVLGLKEYFWNHSLSEIISPLLSEGLSLESIMEYDYSPYNCFENMVEVQKGRYALDINGVRPPHLLEFKARKKGIDYIK